MSSDIFLPQKACGVRVNEFSIGMGPAIFHTTKGETEYSLRLLPIGGFCAMEGEDEESDDPRALERQGFGKKLLIFVAGAAMNFLTGFVIMLCLYAGAQGFYTAEIVELDPAFPQQGENGIMVGDVIWAINGERIYLKSDVSTVLGVVDLDENGTIEMTVKRGSEAQAHADAADLYGRKRRGGAPLRLHLWRHRGSDAACSAAIQLVQHARFCAPCTHEPDDAGERLGRTGRSQRAGRHRLDHQGRGRGGAGGGRRRTIRTASPRRRRAFSTSARSSRSTLP